MLTGPFLLLSLLTAVLAVPELKLGRTTLSGRDVSPRVEFYGIPFAEPPVGARRLRPTVLKTRLNAGRFDASRYGMGCVQPLADPSTLSEDCLTINIHRPKGLKSSAKLPVLFWTYGGAFVLGSSNTYNGSEIVERSVARGTPLIFVNFNYRLGPLGFPQGREADDQRALNLGVLDQMAALEWVQENIGSFGGDKKKVTIFGESAGSMMTGLLYMQPELEHWARGALLTVVQEVFIPIFSSRLYAKGQFARIPFIAGTNLDEGTFFSSRESLSNQALKDSLLALSSPRSGSQDALSAALDQVLMLYPEDPSVGSPYGTGDELFGFPPSYKRQSSIIVHGSEIQFVFGQIPPTSPDSLPPYLPPYGSADEAARNISTVMMDYWISFAVTLNPNDGKGIQRPHWPQYTPAKKVLMQLRGGNTTVIQDDYRKEGIAFLHANAAVLQH
ncbi:hypothetical protein H1R20_g1873, partial [Candolleomyces eurysporus]